MNINACKQWVDSHRDVFIDLIRIYLGAGLFLKALYLMSHREELAALMQETENLWFAPLSVLHYVIPAHLIGGVLLALGLLTRIAALAQIPILIGAIFFVHLPNMREVLPRQDLEFSALVLFLLIVILVHGAGRWSLDHVLARRVKAPAGRPAEAKV